MLKTLLVVVLTFGSTQAFAEESWLDSALDFLGFGSEDTVEAAPKEAESMQPIQTAPSPHKDLTTTAKNIASSTLSSMITSQLGVSDAQAKGGLGALFGLAKSSLGGQEFNQLKAQIPEMDSLLAAAPAISENAQGLSSLMGNAGKYGKALQGATTAYSQFKQLGIGADKIPAYIDVTNNFLKSQGSDDAATLFQKGVAALLTAGE